jgi:hypothetical protein
VAEKKTSKIEEGKDTMTSGSGESSDNQVVFCPETINYSCDKILFGNGRTDEGQFISDMPEVKKIPRAREIAFLSCLNLSLQIVESSTRSRRKIIFESYPKVLC